MGVRLPVRYDHKQVLWSVEDLLGRYAWYQPRSNEHAWSAGSLQPNDLGLSDMLGNVCEWVNDRLDTAMALIGGRYIDKMTTSEYVYEKIPRFSGAGRLAINRR